METAAATLPRLLPEPLISYMILMALTMDYRRMEISKNWFLNFKLIVDYTLKNHYNSK